MAEVDAAERWRDTQARSEAAWAIVQRTQPDIVRLMWLRHNERIDADEQQLRLHACGFGCPAHAVRVFFVELGDGLPLYQDRQRRPAHQKIWRPLAEIERFVFRLPLKSIKECGPLGFKPAAILPAIVKRRI